MTQQRIKILECHACGGLHNDVEIHEYNHPCGSFTHWYSCPTSGDPVSLTISSGTGLESVSIPPDLMRKVREASRVNRYLACIFWVDESLPKDDQLQHTQESNNFPTKDYLPCVRWLEQQLLQAGGPLDNNTLPEATERGPIVSLFGDRVGAVPNTLPLPGSTPILENPVEGVLQIQKPAVAKGTAGIPKHLVDE